MSLPTQQTSGILGKTCSPPTPVIVHIVPFDSNLPHLPLPDIVVSITDIEVLCSIKIESRDGAPREIRSHSNKTNSTIPLWDLREALMRTRRRRIISALEDSHFQTNDSGSPGRAAITIPKVIVYLADTYESDGNRLRVRTVGAEKLIACCDLWLPTDHPIFKGSLALWTMAETGGAPIDISWTQASDDARATHFKTGNTKYPQQLCPGESKDTPLPLDKLRVPSIRGKLRRLKQLSNLIRDIGLSLEEEVNQVDEELERPNIFAHNNYRHQKDSKLAEVIARLDEPIILGPKICHPKLTREIIRKMNPLAIKRRGNCMKRITQMLQGKNSTKVAAGKAAVEQPKALGEEEPDRDYRKMGLRVKIFDVLHQSTLPYDWECNSETMCSICYEYNKNDPGKSPGCVQFRLDRYASPANPTPEEAFAGDLRKKKREGTLVDSPASMPSSTTQGSVWINPLDVASQARPWESLARRLKMLPGGISARKASKMRSFDEV